MLNLGVCLYVYSYLVSCFCFVLLLLQPYLPACTDPLCTDPYFFDKYLGKDLFSLLPLIFGLLSLASEGFLTSSPLNTANHLLAPALPHFLDLPLSMQPVNSHPKS